MYAESEHGHSLCTLQGFTTNDNGEKVGYNTMIYSEGEVERIAHVAFQAAQKRGKRLTSVEKSNVLEVSMLWKEVVTRIGAQYPDVELTHMYDFVEGVFYSNQQQHCRASSFEHASCKKHCPFAPSFFPIVPPFSPHISMKLHQHRYIDNAAMQMIRNPKSFDTIVTGNIFGDILSDEASMLTGSLGMLPSASISDNGMLRGGTQTNQKTSTRTTPLNDRPRRL